MFPAKPPSGILVAWNAAPRQPSTYQGFHSRYIDKKNPLPFHEIFKITPLIVDVIFSGNASVFYKAGAVSIPKRE